MHHTSLRPGSDEGSVLIVVLLLMVSLSGVCFAHLSKVVVENRKLEMRESRDRARALAEGELEIAKNVINASPYDGNNNRALMAALASTPPLVPGTNVAVEALGDSQGNWFRLTARANFCRCTQVAQINLRQRSPASSYNMFVEDHPVGVSGTPRGLIHTNKSVDFYFADGVYHDRVSAVEGFDYRAGATAENTSFPGGASPNAGEIGLLSGSEVTDAEAKADLLKITENLIVEIDLQGTQAVVDLYKPAHYIAEPRTGTRNVIDHFDTVSVVRQFPVYRTETYTVDVPVYEYYRTTITVDVPIYETQRVTENRTRRVWVEDDPPSAGDVGGGAVAGGSTGHWENESYTVTVDRQVQVGSRREDREVTRRREIGRTTETRTRRVLDHMEDRVVTEDRPVYRTETYTYYVDVLVPEQFVETRTVGTSGVMYFAGPVRKFSGHLDGQLSVVTNQSLAITGSVQYRDSDGDAMMTGGLDPAVSYANNPDYNGSAVLGVIARDDITYSRAMPEHAEINAVLISAEGKVAFEGINLSDDGTDVSVDYGGHDRSEFLKGSLRRLGGVVSRHRPVTTYVGPSYGVLAGFAQGQSQMDGRLLVQNGGGVIPPFVFQVNTPLWTTACVGRTLETL